MRGVFLLAGCLILLAIPAGAQSRQGFQSFPTGGGSSGSFLALDSVEGAVTNDFPLDRYQLISHYNLGGQARVTLLQPTTGIRVSALVDSNYWMVTPRTVSFGTQNNLMVGGSYSWTLWNSPDAGSLSVGAGIDYGLMTHYATGTWSEKTSVSGFWLDQLLVVEAEASFRFSDTPFAPYVRPRFLFSPELNDLQKYELGLLVGMRYHLGADAWNTTGVRRRVLSVEMLLADRPVQSVEVLTGESKTLQARLIPSRVENKAVSWQSSDLSVATIDPSGVLKAVGRGHAVITVISADGGKKAKLDLTVLTSPDAFLANLDPVYSPGDTEKSVTNQVTLLEKDPDGTSVSWTSSVPAVVGSDGKVVRPEFGSGNRPVTLSASLNKAGKAYQKTYQLTVLEKSQGDADAVAADLALVKILYSGKDTASSVTLPLGLPVKTKSGSTVTWSSTNPEVVGPDGAVLRPTFGKGDASVELTATVRKGENSQAVSFPVVVKENLQTASEALASDAAILAPRYAEGESSSSVKTKVGLPVKGTNGSAVKWSSDKPGVVAPNGTVTRPLGSDALVKLTATLGSGKVTLTREFVLTVKDWAVEKDLGTVAIGYLPGDSAASVTGSLTFPLRGPNGTSVSWTTNNTAVVGSDGKTVRPLGADRQVRVVATVQKGDQTGAKEFWINVRDRSVVVDAENLAIGFAAGDTALSVTQAVGLMAQGANGTTVLWSSAAEGLISAAGAVTRPLDHDRTVVLTATVQKAGLSATRSFTLNVCDGSVEVDLGSAVPIFAPGDSERWVTADMTLPQTGKNGTRIVWEPDLPGLISSSGKVVRPVGKDTEVTLKVKVSKAGRTKGGEQTVLVKDDAVRVDTAALEVGFGPSDSVDFVSKSLTLASKGANGTTVTWQADNPAILARDGTLTRPLGEDRKVVLTATVTKTDQTLTKSWNLVVKDGTEEQVARDIAAQLKANKITGVTVTETKRGVTIIATDLNFAADSAEFTTEITRKVTVLASILKWVQSARTKILVEGHAANVGDPASVLQVSQSRAKAVSDFIVAQGAVTADRISWVGKGGTVPVGDNSTAEGRVRNRRVEIVIMKVSP